MVWRPLSARNDASATEMYDVLHDGVPEWLGRGAGEWVSDLVQHPPYDGPTTTDLLQTIEQLLRFPLSWRNGAYTALDSVCNEVAGDGVRALDILDCCLMLSRNWPGGSAMRSRLDLMLRIAGSAWEVDSSSGMPCLQRRVDESAERAARTEMEQAGNPGRHLALAWHKVYGRQPDPSGGFREAVRAVEAAAKPVATPKDPVSTLGKMIIAMRDKPSKWTSDLGTVEQLVEMMKQLWTSQLDRHGTDDESVRLSVSPEAAEAAVHLAVLLVHWFRNGHVKAV